MCLTSSNTYAYDSTFDNDPSTLTYTSTISVGTDENELSIDGSIQTVEIRACTINLYFEFEYEESIKSLLQLPLNFHSETSLNL